RSVQEAAEPLADLVGQDARLAAVHLEIAEGLLAILRAAQGIVRRRRGGVVDHQGGEEAGDEDRVAQGAKYPGAGGWRDAHRLAPPRRVVAADSQERRGRRIERPPERASRAARTLQD